ncbi:ABC transporter ATP-binding protein [Caproicibacter fermentans]|uniref:ABC transporter ATP-binding protein n=1 Tax=Caproicibacter fermentans TaxID=2576756 RepID=A0A7G8T857_9FIRM|nr:ABC transporter ATP-binding protein [Caproicibacter fermentans]QNK39798.1 ABC transporter ATP-binding protein [Caproicibacter fermentans]
MFRVLKKISSFAGGRRRLMRKSIGISFIGAIFSALQFYALSVVLSAVLAENRNAKTAWIALGIMLVSIAGRAVSSYFSNMQQTEIGYYMVAEKRIHIGDRLRYIPMGFFNRNSLGDITAVVTTTLGDVENSASRCMVSVLGGLLTSVALGLGVCAINWRIGLIVLTGIALYLLVTEAARRVSSKSWPKRQRAQEGLVAAVMEYLQGMSVVKAFNLEGDGDQAIRKAIDESCERNLGVTRRYVPGDILKAVVIRLAGIAILTASVILYLHSELSLAHCLIMLIASFMVYSELESAGNMASLLQMMEASMDKANSIDDMPMMDTDGEDIVPATSDIIFDHVNFSYGDRKVLNGIDLTLPAKTTTAVVGPSGGGKTTLCNLIARFWDVDSGSITIGGYDVRKYKLDSLMKNVAMVFQNVYLFNDTVENNIKFGKPDATHEQVVAAAKAACCDEFISALPDGYGSMVGEGGCSLSGGEKQRISIARAMLKDAPIVILDEATASVDPENEAELQNAIDALTHNKTLIMIAHRLKTVRKADQILVLNNGKIVQKGTHDELAEQPGIYSEFLNARREAIGWKLA